MSCFGKKWAFLSSNTDGVYLELIPKRVLDMEAQTETSEKGLVTVITPVFNRAEFVEASMDSVWRQNYRPIELIIIDDGSTDESPNIVERWCDSRMGDQSFSVTFMRQANRGACAARNTGLRVARGQYIQWLDDDDIMYPRKLEVQVAFLRAHPEVDAVACQLDYATRDLRVFGRTTMPKPSEFEDMRLFALKHDILGYAPVYRKSILESVGGWRESIPCGQDTDLHARLGLAGARFAVIDECLGVVRCHSKGRAMGSCRWRQPASYNRVAYERIHEFARARGVDSEALHRAIAERLRSAAYSNFARFRTRTGQECLRGMHAFVGRNLSPWDFLGRHACGTPFVSLGAFGLRCLRAICRRMTTRVFNHRH